MGLTFEVDQEGRGSMAMFLDVGVQVGGQKIHEQKNLDLDLWV